MAQWQFGVILFAVSVLCLVVQSKVYERCELAKVLYRRYRLGLAEVAQWVCIAKHSSNFNTAAQASSLTGGSHGLFQISDVYWCSPPGHGVGCGLSCHKLRDDDLTDDLSCAKRIFYEHQRISGDGYTAWSAYQQYCKQNALTYIQDCFPDKHKEFSQFSSAKHYNSVNAVQDYSLKKPGRVYERCELARELFSKHKMPMQEIPTWVCIAEHESRLNTAAVGHLNADGSADHGIFQISDLYWCSHDRFSGVGGKACGMPCSKLLDSDITDDVQCVRRIFREHTAISGDGFTAWTVYKPHCKSQGYEKIANCFKNIPQRQNKMEIYGLEVASNQGLFTTKFNLNNKNSFLRSMPNLMDKVYKSPRSNNDILEALPYLTTINGISSKAKAYTRCSLAQELFFKYKFLLKDISTWVCIAEHESQLNTAAIGRSNTDGSHNLGIFQISDRYWCDHTEQGGKACNLPCIKLLDDDIKDDVACIKTIFEEHTRLSGDGFNAWTVYKPHCQSQVIEHIKTCFDEKTANFETMQSSSSFNVEIIQEKGKTYSKCELAQELYHKHHMSMEQIPKWVCIAQHESSFSTTAVGRLNTDGSIDNGLFQISDLYWCSHEPNGGKACNIPCDKLLDSDITDDVKCIKIIHEEHTRISGDGFNAWTVYKPHCSSIKINHIKECFTQTELKQALVPDISIAMNSLEPIYKSSSKATSKGKVYEKCELAQELLIKHKMPINQVPIWVCIAQYESSLNTAAVGRLNADGSLDHGLFQISDLYWCLHDKYGGKACNIPCDKLLDSDITDDIQCIKVIYEEHTRLSGDGFNAWTVYKPRCYGRKLEEIENCFSPNQIAEFMSEKIFLKTDKHIFQNQQDFGKVSYSCNPFLSGLKPLTSNEVKTYGGNPFLQNIKIASGSEKSENIAILPSRVDNKKQQSYKHNPFLSKYLTQLASSQNYEQRETVSQLPSSGNQHRFETSIETNYENNPFLNGEFSYNYKLPTKPNAKSSEINKFKNNHILSHIKFVGNDMLVQPSLHKKSFLLTDSYYKSNKTYVNTHDFRSPPTTPRTSETTTNKPNIRTITPTTTTPKPVTTKTTISSYLGKKTTTEAQKSNTSWNWQIQRYFNATTTTRSPKPSTTWQVQRKYYSSVTTIKPSTAVIGKPILSANFIQSATSIKHLATTTENWRKWDRTTSIKPTILQQKSSTTKGPTITDNWRKWDSSTAKKSKIIQQKALTTRPHITTGNSTKLNKTTSSYYNTTTTKISTTMENWRTYKYISTTTENWRKWDKTSTTKSSIVQKKSSATSRDLTTKNPITWDKPATSKYKLTTAKPLTVTENFSNTGKKINITNHKFTTTKPQSRTENWRKWDKTTTNTYLGTKPPTQISNDNLRKWGITTAKTTSSTTTEIEKNTSIGKTMKTSLPPNLKTGES